MNSTNSTNYSSQFFFDEMDPYINVCDVSAVASMYATKID